jgi:hypothetical protein
VTHLGATADIVRGTNNGRWAASRPQWTLMRHWLGEIPEWCSPGDGYRELTRPWLRTFGPGTVDDLVWWLGATKTVVRKSLAELDAVAVTLDDGGTGWILPDDAGDVAEPGSWVALLPPLDPTVMGWQGRNFYLGPHRELVIDSRGNAGATVWADGRIVGVWGQDAAGIVEMRLLERLSGRVRRAVDEEAARLTAWLGGVRTGHHLFIPGDANLIEPHGRVVWTSPAGAGLERLRDGGELVRPARIGVGSRGRSWDSASSRAWRRPTCTAAAGPRFQHTCWGSCAGTMPPITDALRMQRANRRRPTHGQGGGDHSWAGFVPAGVADRRKTGDRPAMPLDRLLAACPNLPPLHSQLTTPDGVEIVGFEIEDESVGAEWWRRLRDLHPRSGLWPTFIDLGYVHELAR